MMKTNKHSWSWVFYTAQRFFSTKRKEKGHLSSMLSILGLGVGVMALITVIGVMNGFQRTYIDNILEMGSFHLRYYLEDQDPQKVITALKSNKSLKAAIPVIEGETLVSSDFSEPRGLLLKGLPQNYDKLDPGLGQTLQLLRGQKQIEDKNGILIGIQLARALRVTIGDPVYVVKLKGVKTFNIGQETETFIVSGMFKTGYLDFDQNVAIIDYEKGRESFEGPDGPFIGIKIQNETLDKSFINRLDPFLDKNKMISWREFNKSFFGALRMEKLMMMFLVGLIFLVVGFNINHIMNRAVLERSEEIAILRALGASPQSLQFVFWIEGAVIGLLGSLGGTLTGLWVGGNISLIFQVLEQGINSVIGILNYLTSPWDPYGLSEVSFYSSGLFYLEGMPCKFYVHEVILITFAGLMAAWIAAYNAAGKVAKLKPMEILRDE